jgi:hypothetical protein
LHADESVSIHTPFRAVLARHVRHRKVVLQAQARSSPPCPLRPIPVRPSIDHRPDVDGPPRFPTPPASGRPRSA